MSAANRTITRADILSMEEYGVQRRERRAALLPIKKDRRIDVGPHATFYFENYDTMWLQIHEMLFIEKGGDEQIDDELNAYNPLIPQGGELVATLMFEIDDEVRRKNVLLRLGGIEEHVFVQVGEEKIYADAERDVDRTASDGKTSSVHFLHFRLSAAQVDKFRDLDTQIVLGMDHENYAHMTVLSEKPQSELAKDL